MKHVTDIMTAYLAEELAPADRARVEDHCAGCAACAAELEKTRRAWALLETADVTVNRNPRLWAAVRERTLDRDEWFFGARPWTRRGWATGALAAGLMMGVLLPGAFSPGEAEADPVDPILSGSTWNEDATEDLASWWLGDTGNEEDDR